MNNIPQETAVYLYDRVAEIDTQDNLTPKEKVPKLRSVADSLFKEMVREEKIYIEDLFQRMKFVFTKYSTPQEIVDMSHRLRQYSNKLVHELEMKAEPKDYLASLKAIIEIIKHFSGVNPPDALVKKTEGVSPFDIKMPERKKTEIIPFLSGIILSIRRRSETGKNFASIFCSTDELGDINVTLWENADANANAGTQFDRLADMAWKYARVHFFNIQKVQDRENLYSTRKDSLAILEPDYLIDASELAECFQAHGSNAMVSMLNKFKPKKASESMMLGNIANSLLDDHVTAPSREFDESVDGAFREHALSTIGLCSSQGRFDGSVIESIRERAKAQDLNLKKIMREFPKKDNNIYVEPSFFSDRFGLQGRLDLLLENKETPGRKDIIELKSGSAPNLSYGAGLWPNHEMQAVTYCLLVESVYPGRAGNSFILYSSKGQEEKPLRLVSDSQSARQDLLMLRNEIIANEFRLSEKDYGPVMRIKPESFGLAPKFDIPYIDEFARAFSSADSTLRKYFLAFVSFTARELRTAKLGNGGETATEGFAGLWRKSLQEKREAYTILDQLNIDAAAITDDYYIRLTRTVVTNPVSDFRKGDIAILYPVLKEKDSLNPMKTKVLKCSVVAIDRDSITVSLRNKQTEKGYFKLYKTWSLEHDFMESNYKTMYQSLYAFLNADEHKKKVLFGTVDPAFLALNYKPVITGLNAEQASIVEKALSAKDYFLIQGPPGTGKTSIMLTALAKNLFEKTDENFVILAFTNRAVDEICANLKKRELPYIRMGRSDTGDDEEWRQIVRTGNLQKVHQELMDNRIFVSTQASFASSLDILDIKPCSTVIVDEASQLLEPSLVGILTRFERFILIGDEKQLPAVVMQEERYAACDDKDLNAIGLLRFNESLFDRLIRVCETKKWKAPVAMLTTQGRMHEKIAEFVNVEYYGGHLTTVRPEQTADKHRFDISAEDPYERAIATHRVVFIPTARSVKELKINHEQAKHAAGLIRAVKKVYGKDFNETTVGVITPYRAQIANIIAQGNISEEMQAQVTIDTVERYQGSQRDIIIYSVAVNRESQLPQLQSLTPDGKVDRRLNVALTRAKDHLIILGCPEVLAKNAHYGKLVEFIRKNGGWVTI